MSNGNGTCKGLTLKGSPCKLSPVAGFEHCRFHLPEKIEEKERQRVKSFFLQHEEGILGFLGGMDGEDPVASDIYSFIKEQLQMQNRAKVNPPGRAVDNQLTRLISRHYQQYHDKESLEKLMTRLCESMGEDEVVKLFGKPHVLDLTNTEYKWYYDGFDREHVRSVLRLEPDYQLGLFFSKKTRKLTGFMYLYWKYCETGQLFHRK